MLRIIVIAVLSVLTVVLSGCERIKTELERRHLGSEEHKSASTVTPNALKTLPVNRNDSLIPSERKQIVFRIDLPADEKIQIRLIKNSVHDESNTDAGAISKDDVKAAAIPKESVFPDKPESPAASEKKTSSRELEPPKDDESKSEIKELYQESHSELNSDQEEAFPAPPVPVPTVFVPAREKTSPPAMPYIHKKDSLHQSEMAPAENAVGLALNIIPPASVLSEPSKTLNEPPETIKPSNQNPWSIPNAEYPLRYY